MDQFGDLSCLGKDNGPEAVADAIDKKLCRIEIGAFFRV